MKKVLVFGASTGGFNYIENQNEYEIIGLIDNDQKKHETIYYGVKVHSPEELKGLSYDYVVIASMYIKSITRQLVEELKVDRNKILYAPKSMMKIKTRPFENQKTLRLAKKVLVEVTEYLEIKGYKYFINFGTLLGITREGDLLAWDDDIDIAIIKSFQKDQLFLVHIVKFLEGISARWNLQITSSMKFDNQNKLLGIDLIINNEENACFVVSLDLLYFKGENAYLPIDILPTRFFLNQDEVYLEGKALKAPSPYKEYLTYIYQEWGKVRKNVTFNDNTTTFNEPEWINIKKALIKGEK